MTRGFLLLLRIATDVTSDQAPDPSLETALDAVALCLGLSGSVSHIPGNQISFLLSSEASPPARPISQLGVHTNPESVSS